MDNLTIVIPFCNGHATVGRLLQGLPRHLRVIVVDDLSDEPFAPPALKNVEVVRLAQKGYFSGAVNAGLARCAGDALVLNQDAELVGDDWKIWLDGRRETYALIGEGVFSHPAWPQGYVQGTFMYLRRDAWEKVGPFNARDYPLWGATAEWQLRACRQGYRALTAKPSEIPGFRHAVGRTAHTGDSIAELLRREPERRGLFIRTPPAVSVIIPCYNYARYLPDAVHSLLGGASSLGEMPPQTLASFEVVIVNDGSTDDTRAVGEALADAWQGVRYVERPNGGTAAANNTGLQNAYGPYFTILSADDMRESFALEALYRYSEANPGRAVCDDMVIFGGGQRQQVARMTDENGLDFLLGDNPMHAGALYPRPAWQQVGGYPEQFGDGREDWAFNLRLASAGVCAAQTHLPGYLYRREGQNRTLGNYAKKAWFVDKLRAMVPDIYKGARPMGCCGSGNQRTVTIPDGLPAATLKLAGADGMVLVEYLGGSSGETVFTGKVTHTRYVFGGKRTRGYVDARDAEALLTIREYKADLFRRVAPEPPASKPDPASQVGVTFTAEQKETIAEIAALNATIPEVPVVYAPPIDPVAFTAPVVADQTAGLKPAAVRKGRKNS